MPLRWGPWSMAGIMAATLTANACSRHAPPTAVTAVPSDSADQVSLPDTSARPIDSRPIDTMPPAPPPVRRPYAAVRLAFTGDINLGTSTLVDGIPPDSGRGLFRGAQSMLTGDLVIGNLEGVLADSGTSYKCQPPTPLTPPKPERRRPKRPPPPIEPPAPCYAFLTPTHLAPRLADAGFTHLNLANNHAHDYGMAGRASTETTLRALGLKFYGPVGHIAIDSIERGDSVTRVALVGFTTYPHSYDLLDIVRSVAVVDSIRRLADLVIVTFHGGTEGLAAMHVPDTAEYLGREPRGDLRRWTRAVIDAGADVVVGHGPHVLRGLEFYRGKLIAYSLGNFLTYRGFNLKEARSLTGVLHVEFTPDRALHQAHFTPMRQVPLQGVFPDPDRTATTLLRTLSTEDFGPNAARIAEDGTITQP